MCSVCGRDVLATSFALTVIHGVFIWAIEYSRPENCPQHPPDPIAHGHLLSLAIKDGPVLSTTWNDYQIKYNMLKWENISSGNPDRFLQIPSSNSQQLLKDILIFMTIYLKILILKQLWKMNWATVSLYHVYFHHI